MAPSLAAPSLRRAITMNYDKDDYFPTSGGSYGTAGAGTIERVDDQDRMFELDNDDESLASTPLRSDMGSVPSAEIGTSEADSTTDVYALPAPLDNDVPQIALDPKPTIQSIATTARQQAGQIADQAKSQAGVLASQAADAVKSQIDTQKSKAADNLGSLSNAIRQSADSLSQNGQPQIAGVVTSAAEKIDDVTSYLRNKNVDEIASEINDYARQNPQIFIGGAFLLGIAVARFLKSSQRSDIAAA
jgi:hypothetical protein